MGGATPAPAPTAEPAPQAGGAPTPAPAAEPATNDKPFNDEPFDAGIETDEESDPKKFIEQLSGKLGQSLRKYTEKQGQPDFELEKFAVNSLLSATHTSEMDSEDQNDIIKKVKTAGNNEDTDDNSSDNKDDSNPNPSPSDGGGSDANNVDLDVPNGDNEENMAESKKKDPNFLFKPKKLSIFAPEGSEESKLNIKAKLDETFNQEKMTEPATKPVVKPAPTKTPAPTQPSRKNKPFLPSPNVQPTPKAKNMKEIETAISKEKKEVPNETILAHELASMSKNVNNLIEKQSAFFQGKNIEGASITNIIAKAAEIIKNR